MTVQQIMTESPACCGPNDKIEGVARMMVENDCGCIPVTDNAAEGKVVGMITDRDIVTRAVAEGKNPLDLTVRDLMTSDVACVTQDASVEDCITLMEQRKVRRIAVVDDKGSCVGIVAQADIANNTDQRKTAEVVQEVSKASA